MKDHTTSEMEIQHDSALRASNREPFAPCGFCGPALGGAAGTGGASE